jgi:hypothetical protein
MIGRIDLLERLVKEILEENRPIVVLGESGMGKTTLTLAAAYDRRIVARFRRRLLVNCEPLKDAGGLLRRLAANLGIAASGNAYDVETRIVAACVEAPALVILDDLEALWATDMAATKSLLGRLAETTGLRLILTFRDMPPILPGAGAFPLRVGPLGLEDARALFFRHAGDDLGKDAALDGILIALDGDPVSIHELVRRSVGRLNMRGMLDRATFIRQHRPAS